MRREYDYVVAMYRPPAVGQIGPQCECEDIRAAGKTDAIRRGKALAKERGWRYIAYTPGSGGRRAFGG